MYDQESQDEDGDHRVRGSYPYNQPPRQSQKQMQSQPLLKTYPSPATKPAIQPQSARYRPTAPAPLTNGNGEVQPRSFQPSAAADPRVRQPVVNQSDPLMPTMPSTRRLLCALRVEIDFERHEDLNIYEGDDFRFRVQRFVEKFNLAEDAVD